MTQLNAKFHENQTWTHSRHITFKDCRRQYWFDYISPYVDGLSPELSPKLKELKNLTTTRFVMGSLVHESIEEFLTQLDKGRAMVEGEFLDLYLQKVDAFQIKVPSPFSEVLNGQPLDPGFFDRIKQEGTGQLRMFLRVLWPPLSRNEKLQHERLEQFKIGSARIGLKVDLVTRTADGRIFVTDWKTGSYNPKYESQLQLAVYSLWASSKYDTPLENVVADLAYLKAGKTSGHSLTAETAETIRRTIQEEFDSQSRETAIDQNPPSPEPRRCISCKYASVCDARDTTLARP